MGPMTPSLCLKHLYSDRVSSNGLCRMIHVRCAIHKRLVLKHMAPEV